MKLKKAIYFALVIIIVDGCAKDDFSSLCETDKTFRERYRYITQGDQKKPPENIDVVVDVTGSMKGFCNASESLKEFLQTIDASFYPKRVTFWAFSNRIDSVGTFFPLLKSNIYTGKRTMYDKFSDFIESKEDVILITDLQFNREEEWKIFSNLVKSYIEVPHNCVKILGSKLAFAGKYYPRGGDPNAYYSGKRPIYAIIFTKIEHIDYFNDAIKKSNIWQHTLTFYNNFPYKFHIELPDTYRVNYFIDYLESFCTEGTIDPKENSVVVWNWKLNGGKGELLLGIDYQFFSEWENLEKSNFILDKYKITYNDTEIVFIRDNRISESIMAAKTGEKNSQILLKISFEDVDIRNDYVFVVKINPRELPHWVSEWSTNFKQQVSMQANHTLYLDKIMNDIINSVTSPYILGYGLVFLKNN